jgi:hypothetical protein
MFVTMFTKVLHWVICFIWDDGRVVPVFSWAPRHEDVRGSENIAPSILNLDTRWRLVVSFAPQPFYPRGKGPLDRRLGGLVWTLWKREKYLAPTGIEARLLRRPAYGTFSTPTLALSFIYEAFYGLLFFHLHLYLRGRLLLSRFYNQVRLLTVACVLHSHPSHPAPFHHANHI